MQEKFKRRKLRENEALSLKAINTQAGQGKIEYNQRLTYTSVFVQRNADEPSLPHKNSPRLP